MARANLTFSSEIQDAFLAAQDSSSVVRSLIISISGETILLSQTTNISGSTSEDFDAIRNILKPNEAALVLFCLSEKVEGNSANQWMLLAWVPDSCKVRDKMLYSSSKEDVKRNIGLGYFTHEYSANSIEDVSWAQYQNYISKDNNDVYLTNTERLILEEKVKHIINNTLSNI